MEGSRRLAAIVSGGQTGVDRAALDVAMERGIPCGGWCPAGRRAEDGAIDPRYPLRETPSADPAQRTEWNVRDSDGTVLLIAAGDSPGTALAHEAARRLGRPVYLWQLDALPDLRPLSPLAAGARNPHPERRRAARKRVARHPRRRRGLAARRASLTRRPSLIHPSMIRILLLCLPVCLAAACDSGDPRGAARDGRVRFDTAAGFQLGMLIPEAREAAAARGDRLECVRESDVFATATLPDSTMRRLREMDTCDPAHERYRLHFFRGSLQSIVVPYSADWDRVPLDTLVARLSAKWGAPGGREEYTYEGGRRELLIYWQRRGAPGEVNLRCPRGARTGECTRVHHRGTLPR